MQHGICGDHEDVVDSCVVSLLQELQHRVLDSNHMYQTGVKGLSVVQGAVPCQQHWYQDHAIRGVAGLNTS
jgi:hypothetical protein